MTRFAIAAVLTSLLCAQTARAGARHIPHWSLETDDDVKKSLKAFGFTAEGKPATYPKKVAVPWFHVRYDFTAVEGDHSAQTIQFSADDYQQLTDDLYDHLVRRLEGEGFEVIGKDAVTATAAWKALEGDTDPKESGGRARHAPTGMKVMTTRLGEPTKPGSLAAINAELGTDAVLAVYANIAICPVELTPNTGMVGSKPCLKGAVGFPGLSIAWIGGAEGTGEDVKPAWKARVYKELVPFVYAKREMSDGNLATTEDTAETYDAALISPRDAATWNKQNFWGNRTGNAEVGAFAQGADDMFDVALTLGFEAWYGKADDTMAAAGVTRPPRAPAPEGSRVVVGAELRAERRDVREQVEEAKAEFEARRVELAAMPDGPPLTGAITCYDLTGTMTTAAGEVPAGPTVLRRGIDGTQMIDEQLSLSAGTAVVQKTVYEVLDGGYVASELKGYFKGHGTYEGPSDAWTSWSGAYDTGQSTFEVTGTTDGSALHLVTKVKMPDGTSPVSFDHKGTRIDAATCTTRWDAVMAMAGKKKKPKK